MSKIPNQHIAADFCSSGEVIKNLLYVTEIDSFAWYDHGYFKIIPQKEIEKKVYMFMVTQYKGQNVTMSNVKDIIAQIKFIVHTVIPDVTTDYIGISETHILNKNTLQIEAFGPGKIALTKIPLSVEDTGPPAKWQKFLSEVLVDSKGGPDLELHDLIQEIFGYCLLNTLEAHASFFLVGGGRNGKSVTLAVLREMVGSQFVESISIETLTTNQFAAHSLVGKVLNICGEEESKFIKSDKFKAMVSGDPMTVNRKYDSMFTWIPTVKYIFSTNEMPTFTGFNEGLLRRIIILPFNHKVTAEQRITNLDEQLIKELPSITAWALDGARRLKKNGFAFTKSAQADKKKIEFQENISSAVLFFNERYEIGGESDSALAEQMYDEYVAWAQKRGKKTGSYYTFIKDVEVFTNLPEVNGKIQVKPKVWNF